MAANLAIALLTVTRFGSTTPFALQFGLLTFTITGLLIGAAATETWLASAKLRHQAMHDELTGLPNRALFREGLAQALAARQRSGSALAVAILDLDTFKDVNDTLGHPAGDALLVEVGRRLQAALGPGDIVARLGGDEFGLLLGIADPSQAQPAFDRIMRLFDTAFTFDCIGQIVTTSAGVAVYPGDGNQPDQLMRHADLALYEAKSAGRAGCRLFSPELTDCLRIRLETERDLRRALTSGELVLQFQPQAECANREVVAAEALVRWAHPSRGMLAPGEFLEFAQSAGLMAALGDWVLREACAQAAGWANAGLVVSVNIAAAQWRGGLDLAEQVESALLAANLPPSRLKLEIVEDALLLTEEAHCLDALRRLRPLGVQVSIDDFGTGHSSLSRLSRLSRLPIDEIKINRSFIDSIGRERDDEAIARTVVTLSRALERRVVAEGVETEAQLAFLQTIGCDLAQGYLFSRPLDSRDFAARLTGRSERTL